MCFSATASFVAGAVLIPIGGVALRRAARVDRRYLVFAAFPLLFGVQQSIEGAIWLGQDAPRSPLVHAGAMAFLLFAYLLWLVLTPLAAFLVETVPWRRRLLFGIMVFGAVFGAAMFVPLALHPEWLTVSFAGGSIHYGTQLIGDGLVTKEVVRVVYAAVICVPLLASTAAGVRGFGVLVALSVVLAFLFATHAFTSVWCFLAALVSGYIVVMLFRLPQRCGPPTLRGAADDPYF